MRKIRHNYPQDARIYEIHNFRVAQLVVVAVTAAAAVAVCLLPMSLPLVFLLWFCCLGSFAATTVSHTQCLRYSRTTSLASLSRLPKKRGVAHCARMRANISFSSSVHFVFLDLYAVCIGQIPKRGGIARPYIMVHGGATAAATVITRKSASRKPHSLFTVGGKSRTSLDSNNNNNHNDPRWLLLVTTRRKCQTTTTTTC